MSFFLDSAARRAAELASLVQLAELLQHHRRLGAGGPALGGEGAVASAADNPGVHGPVRGLQGVGGDRLIVRELPEGHAAPRQVIAHVPGILVEHDGQLFPGDGGVGPEAPVAVATGDPEGGGPAHRLAVPGGRVHVREVHQVVHLGTARQPPQDGDDLPPGGGAVGAEGGLAGAGHEAVLVGVDHRVIEPVVHIHIPEGQVRLRHDLHKGHLDGHPASGLDESI